MHSISLNDMKFRFYSSETVKYQQFCTIQSNNNVGYKENFCEMNILVFIAFLKIQRFIFLKTELKTLAAYHSGHGWNSTNYSCLGWLFPLEQEFSTLALCRIIFKIGQGLKDTDGPHCRMLSQNLEGGG